MRNGRLLLCLAIAGLALVLSACGSTGSASPAKVMAYAKGRLIFGVSPGADPHDPSQKDVAKTTAALRELKAPGRPFVVHLYAGYIGRTSWSKYRAFLSRQLGYFERAGFDVELVLRYAPFDGRGTYRDVRSFVALARRVVKSFGKSPRFASVQITNEPDRNKNPASDGYFNQGKRTWKALIQGVVAAKTTARAEHFNQIKVGFNYAGGNEAFWRYLGSHGNLEFRRALDWIGIDTYPGTVTPLPKGSLQSGIAQAISEALYTARKTYMPLARIPARVALHFSENGFATDAGHTYAMQATALRTAVETVARLSRIAHVTEYDWFELRDANSGDRGIRGQLGLLRSNYQPKPAFAAYRSLIADTS